MFHQIAMDSLRPKQFAALEDGARSLLEAAREGGARNGNRRTGS
jgi:hypothetical protein